MLTSLYKPGNIDHFGNEIYIGKFRNFPNAFTPGVIDDVKIYNRALSGVEILSLYHTRCANLTLNGETEVCQGQQEVGYNVNPVYNNVSYTWSYTGGTGATIHGNGSSINIDFSTDATSGTLTATVMGEGMDPQSASIAIHVNELPADAGIITGDEDVCQGSTGIVYSVPVIDSATSYNWSYSGTGTTIRGNSNSIFIDFAQNAASGNLTVWGYNVCGNGAKSSDFPISVSNCTENPASFNIPNSFSPNRDGVNDVFFIRGLEENSTLTIFDRLGKKLFESSNYQNDWDGRDNDGNILESGTYWYVFYLSGFPSETKGFVYLKR
jgi:gliding motility-associated-like protein